MVNFEDIAVFQRKNWKNFFHIFFLLFPLIKGFFMGIRGFFEKNLFFTPFFATAH